MSSGFVPDAARDALIWERHSRGESVRQIAAAMELSKSYVHKILARLRSVPDQPVGDGCSDPIVALLTEQDLAHLGVSAADVSSGLSALERYRILGLPAGSAARDAARELFDHGRGGDAWRQWMDAGPDPVPVAGEPMAAHVRDERMVELRRDGWTLQQIADALNMTKGGVSRAIERVYHRRPGQQPRG
jgi:transcriptional regulator with XRE-family HTH domain